MLKVNEYFDGKVKSVGFENKEGVVTVGVMEAGTYEFGTSSIEFMTVTSGKMSVLLPGKTEWETFGTFDTFRVEKDCTFGVKVEESTAYKCLYK